MKSMVLGAAVLAAAVVISGCAGMADAMSQMGGMGVVSEKVSTFDGATVVEVTPQFLYDPKRSAFDANDYKLGARWNSNAPDHVALIMAFTSSTGVGDAYANLTGLDVNLNGQKYSFDPGSLTSHDSSGWNSVSNTIYTESQNSVIVPLELLEEMLTAEDVRLRIHSSEGYEDAVFSIERRPGGQGLALLSIREFAERVKQKMAVLSATGAEG